ncbi:MAG: hypothetical protein MR794_01420 [Bacteroidales bacterium]|nr:hypothetical protein [Bacteroidales bacterium]
MGDFLFSVSCVCPVLAGIPASPYVHFPALYAGIFVVHSAGCHPTSPYVHFPALNAGHLIRWYFYRH